jgi:hypothetical protein
MSGYLCRCTVCGREERAGLSPLRNGWPKCCGYTMRLEDTKSFIENVERELGACVSVRREDTPA